MRQDNDFSIKILHISPECAPLAKKGGLGDVVGALPKNLNKNNIDSRVLMPAWPGVLEKARKMKMRVGKPIGTVSVAINWRAWTAVVYEAVYQKVKIYILDQPELFSNPDIYPDVLDGEKAYPFLFLSLASFELPSVTGWKPDFLHAHDWTTAFVPIAMNWHKYYSSFNSDYDTVFTIHNLAHQGLFDPAVLEEWGFHSKAFSPYDVNSMEFYGHINLLKGAILTSEAITTVSPSYSWNIQTKDGGFGLDGVILSNKHKLHGIINGLDYDTWSPKTDRMIPAKYTKDNLKGKATCRAALVEKCGWTDDERPIVIFVGRLTEQKGVDIMLYALDRFLPNDIRAVIIGSGNEMYNRKLQDFASGYPDSVHALIGFSEETAHLAYAGGDIMVMPSLFEPCGLSQLIAFAYGTIPVARATGGLADTVIDADGSQDGNGFLFKDYSIDEFAKALGRALEAKRDTQKWNNIIQSAMSSDFSWDTSARAYIDIYNKILVSE